MKTLRRLFGAILMGCGGFLLASTLLSLGTLLGESRAPVWLTLIVALVFLGLQVLLLRLGWRLWRGKERESEEKRPEAEE